MAREKGEVWEMHVLLDENGKVVSIYAKDPGRPVVVDITDQFNLREPQPDRTDVPTA